MPMAALIHEQGDPAASFMNGITAQYLVRRTYAVKPAFPIYARSMT